ncbi:MAG: DUF4405 domain-containing protein [Deltaproteobacteria bacterium]|nr:DUF4405 domain-containing protein [Deltaproteobacteria bacterium]
MKRTAVNFWLDLASLLAMVSLALTGGINHYVLPSGTGNWLTLFGLDRHDYGKIHFYLGFAIVILLALHVAMHWSWLCGFVAKRLGKEQPSRRARLWAGVGTLALFGLLLVGGLAWAASRVENRFGAQDRPRGPSWSRDAQPAGAANQVSATPPRPETAPVSPRRAGLAGRDDEDACPAAAAINGRVTVAEAAAAARLNPAAFLRALGVTEPVDPQERLGRLKRWYGFSIQDVRRLACRQP